MTTTNNIYIETLGDPIEPEPEDAETEREVTLVFATKTGEAFELDGFSVKEALRLMAAHSGEEVETEFDDNLGVGDFSWDLDDILFIRVQEIA